MLPSRAARRGGMCWELDPHEEDLVPEPPDACIPPVGSLVPRRGVENTTLMSVLIVLHIVGGDGFSLGRCPVRRPVLDARARPLAYVQGST